MNVLIPARTNSSRVPNKNFRPFVNGKSLFDIKMDQLLAAGIPASSIFVSCEDEQKREIVERHGAVFLLRDEFLTTPEGEKDLLRALTAQVPEDPYEDDLMLISVTDAFFSSFAQVIRTWQRVRAAHDSLAVVRKVGEQLLSPDGQPANFDYFGQATQSMKAWYSISMCVLVAKRSTVQEVGHYVGRQPYLFVARERGVDVDTLSDFAMASAIWEIIHGNTS